MSFPPNESHADLLARGQKTLGWLNIELAKALGVSRRTITRWQTRRTGVSEFAFGVLAPFVHPKDPALAATMWAIASEFHARFGLPPLPPLPGKPASPAESKGASAGPIEGVLFAACDAADVAPRVARLALLAAVRRAKELGLTMDDVERGLAPVPKKAAAAKR
jgi:hypothetical protein